VRAAATLICDAGRRVQPVVHHQAAHGRQPQPPLVVLDRLGTWDESWKNGYLLATTGLTHPLVPADRYPNFEQWAERDRQAMANYDGLPALLYPLGSWEQMLGECC